MTIIGGERHGLENFADALTPHERQRDAVRASLLLSPTSAERHGTYRRRPTPLNVAYGHALLGVAAVSAHRANTCPRCNGNQEIRVNTSRDGRDPQYDDVVTCPDCQDQAA